jgi:predicted metalloprotease with PDZ domain
VRGEYRFDAILRRDTIAGIVEVAPSARRPGSIHWGTASAIPIVAVDALHADRIRLVGIVPADAIFAVAERHGVTMRADFERYVLNGEELTLPADALGSAYEPVRDSIPSPFDVGFALLRSRQTGSVEGVVTGGPAAAAGLRNGMEIVDLSSWNPLAPDWRRGELLRITVRADSVERVVTISPRGEPVAMRLVRRKRIR